MPHLQRRVSGRAASQIDSDRRLLIVYGRPALITARQRAAIAVQRRPCRLCLCPPSSCGTRQGAQNTQYWLTPWRAAPSSQQMRMF